MSRIKTSLCPPPMAGKGLAEYVHVRPPFRDTLIGMRPSMESPRPKARSDPSARSTTLAWMPAIHAPVDPFLNDGYGCPSP
jgi:hypothetical protein